jgi:putative solute:sodium symporter small subunit
LIAGKKGDRNPYRPGGTGAMHSAHGREVPSGHWAAERGHAIVRPALPIRAPRKPGGTMVDASEKSRWEATVELAIGVIAVAVLVGLVLVLAPLFGEDEVLGLPFRYFLAGLIVPVFLVFCVFWLAGRQNRLDRRFDAAED